MKKTKNIHKGTAKKTIKIILFLLITIGLLFYFNSQKKIENRSNNIQQKIVVNKEIDKKVEIKTIVNIEPDIKTELKVDESQKLLQFGLKTDTSKISIDFSDILNGGPGKDGIPSINNPKFVSIKEAKESMEFLKNDSRGISVEIDGEAKFYPYNIIVWHEIVNDTLGDKKISVTFCPLCGSAIVYDRVIDGTEVNFGVSGFLYQSNLLMYDSETESLWSQSLGESVVGEFLGKELEYIKSNLMTFEEFENNYSKGIILSSDTGIPRNYGMMPYGDYDDSDILYFPVKNEDLRFSKKEIFYIVNDGTESIAFLLKDLRENLAGDITVGSNTYNASYKDGIVDVKKGGEIVKGYYEMWFSWAIHNLGNKNVWLKK